MRRAFFKAAVERGRTLLLLHRGTPAPPWVAGSSVAFLVATPWCRQTAALPIWSFCGKQYLGKAATWCPQVVFLPAGTIGHVPEEYVGRLDLARVERHWQSSVFALKSYMGTLRPPTPRLFGHVTVGQIPVPSQVKLDQAGAS